MRVAQVSHRFLPNVGGVERHVADLSSELCRRGHDVTVFTSDDVRSQSTCPVPENAPFEVRRFPTLLPRTPLFDRALVARGLYRSLVQSKPDLIHSQGYAFYSFNAAWRAARRLKVPLVATPHYYAEANRQLPWAIGRALTLYDRVLGSRILGRDAASVCAVAPTEGRILMKRFRVEASRLHWTPNAVHLHEVEGHPGFAAEHGIEGDFILCLGRLSTQKGQHHLIRIAPRLGVPVVIAGPDWGEGDRLRALAKGCGADGNVRFVGNLPREMALSALREATVVAMPSHWEAFSITLLEAWANRAAVAISDAGGTPDVVAHGRDGLIHPVGDEETLLEHLRLLLDDRSLCRRLGDTGYDNVCRLYAWSEATNRVEAAYGIRPPVGRTGSPSPVTTQV